MGNVVFSGDG